MAEIIPEGKRSLKLASCDAHLKQRFTALVQAAKFAGTLMTQQGWLLCADKTSAGKTL